MTIDCQALQFALKVLRLLPCEVRILVLRDPCACHAHGAHERRRLAVGPKLSRSGPGQDAAGVETDRREVRLCDGGDVLCGRRSGLLSLLAAGARRSGDASRLLCVFRCGQRSSAAGGGGSGCGLALTPLIGRE